MQWVTAWEITQILAPFQQATGTLGRESTIQLKNKRLQGREPGDQVWRVPPPQKQKNQQLETLRVESFTASTAEPRTAQLYGGGVSAITEAVHPYGGSPPLLRQPAVAEATCHNRELRRRATIAKAVLTTPI